MVPSLERKSEAQREVWGQTLVELGAKYPRLVVLDGDLANSTRAELFEFAYPDRFLEMGIAEQNMMGVAAGLATVGMVPWLSSFAVFLASRDLDQLRMVVAQPNLNVKLGAGYAGIMTGKTGKTHQSVDDIAIMRALPNMIVLSPADCVELRQMMAAMMENASPTYLRLMRDNLPNIFGASYRFAFGEVYVVREGSDVTIFSHGPQTVRALDAADILAREGVSAHVVHVPTIKPLNEDAIVREAERTGLVVTTEDHNKYGGLGGAIAEVLGQRHPTRMRIHGWNDTFGESGDNNALLAKYGLAPANIADEARKLLGRA
ncbi:MAG: transketolase family protein [Chloroflexota bacterium]|nr:MAG: transketolase family protein [Chloroflexota bacterium]